MEETTLPTETTSTSASESLPKRYYVQFWKKVQPSNPAFDVLAGTIFWSDLRKDIIIEGLHNRYASKVENFFNNDLALPNGVFVSYAETPKEWVLNLSKAELVGDIYCKDSMEMNDEAQ